MFVTIQKSGNGFKPNKTKVARETKISNFSDFRLRKSEKITSDCWNSDGKIDDKIPIFSCDFPPPLYTRVGARACARLLSFVHAPLRCTPPRRISSFLTGGVYPSCDGELTDVLETDRAVIRAGTDSSDSLVVCLAKVAAGLLLSPPRCTFRTQVQKTPKLDHAGQSSFLDLNCNALKQTSLILANEA